MRIGSLFAGIGGFDLAARWMGWETAWFSEIDPYASAVLAKHWPGVPNLGDITQIEWSGVPRVDLLCGGFPCQDISNAGKRAGIDGARSGLWGEFARAIRELRPRYVVVENVAALLGRGLGRVLGDLATLGYDAEWQILSAADVGAPHLRERIWVVAHTNEPIRRKSSLQRGPHSTGLGSQERERVQTDALADTGSDSGRVQPEPVTWGSETTTASAGSKDVAHPERDRWQGSEPDGSQTSSGRRPADEGSTLADAESERCEEARGLRRHQSPQRTTRCSEDVAHSENPDWRWPDGTDHAGRRDQEAGGCGEPGSGIPDWRIEPDVGRVAHGVPRRVDRLRCLGNAIVPQCAFQIFQAIQAAEERSVA